MAEARVAMPIEQDTGLTRVGLELSLLITDSDLCAELEERPEGRDRDAFAIDAMKIGALALRQVRGQVDVDRVRAEGDRLLESLRDALTLHQHTLADQIGACLKDYFDPQSGRFNERVERLIKEDGELERLLRSQVGGDGSELVRTLSSHLGDSSPLMKLLATDDSDGFLGAFSTSVEKTLAEQRERILSEFSLDNKQGALSRLVAEVAEHHGEVSEALEKRIDEVMAEFSLDREDSALSRLVHRVEQAQTQISSEFSLDAEGSALARMRRELLDVIETQRKVTETFQREVLTALTDMTARKRESERSTRHGNAFEDEVFAIVQERSQRAGDMAARVGMTTGLIKNCKKGDITVDLGPDRAAAGARFVVETKQDASYGLRDAREEIDLARKNRGAEVGLFVFSARTAPAGIESFARYGDDVLVVWDAENPRTDVVLEAGLSIAIALCTRVTAKREAEAADFEAIDRAILEIEKQAAGLDEITKHAETIRSGSQKIVDRARIMRDALAKEVTLLNEKVGDVKLLIGASGE